MKRQMTLRSLLVITCLLLGLSLHAQTVTIHVATAGSLSSYIASTKKDQITGLTLTGNLNGDDICYIREMAGGDVHGNETSGKLSVLDISGVNIVAGGNPYYFYYYSNDNAIGEYMFHNCTQLTSISIPDSVTSIAYSAFSHCNGLTEIIVSKGNISYSSVDGVLFNKVKFALISYPNSKSNSYSIPSSVTTISNGAFSGCSGLTSIIIPSSVTTISNGAFSGCSGLTSIIIPNSVTFIGDEAFSGCSGLTSVTIPNSVTSIRSKAFSGCIGLSSVTISKRVTSIGTWAFFGCSGLTSVIIPNCVTSIGRSAFSGCSGLTSVTIPSNVTSIGEFAFYGCTGLNEIHNNSPKPQKVNSLVFYEVNKMDCKLYVPKGSFSSYWLPEGWGDFANIIEEEVLIDLSFIYVETPGTLSSYIPSNMKNMITDLTLMGALNGTDIRYIREMAGSDVNGIATSGKLSVLDISGANIVAGGDYYYCYNESPYPRQYFYSSDNTMGISLFSGCIGLTSVTIPNSVMSIRSGAFSGCIGLTEILASEENSNFSSVDGVLFNKVKSSLISYPNSKSNSYSIPNSVTSIGDNAFSDCIGLTSVTIPNGVTSIGYAAFYGCIGLTSIIIPNSVTSIGNVAFSGCIGLTSITIGNSVTSIGDYAFSGCIGLTSVTIGNSVTSIGDFAFQNCIGLTSVTICNSVTWIGRFTFSGCIGLTEIHNNNATPQRLNDSDFDGVDKTTCTLYVPKGSYSNYRAALIWSDFTNIIEEDLTSNPQIQTGNIKVYTEAEAILIEGAEIGETISVYTESGALVQTTQATGDIVRINVPSGHTYLIKTVGQTIKIAL